MLEIIIGMVLGGIIAAIAIVGDNRKESTEMTDD